MAQRTIGGTAVAELQTANGVATPVLPASGRLGISIPALRIETLKLRVVGDSILVTHAWSDKAIKMMADKQQKKAQGPKAAKNPHEEYIGSLYWISKKPAKPTDADIKKGVFGVPASAFKRAVVDTCSFIDDVSKVEARGAFHVVGTLLKIESAPPVMREDMVRLSMGVADIRYRAEFTEWAVSIEVRYNPGVLSAEQLVHLFNTAGFSIGVGENRPQKNGSWGMFHVETDKG